MKLQQLRYVWEVAHHNLNVSATAQSLYTSQPGISKQIRLLEDELGVEVFTRSGKHFTQVTPAGEKIIEKAGEVLRMVASIKQVSQEFCNHHKGKLSIAASYAHTRYKLPKAIKAFSDTYPEVVLHMYQGSTEQIVNMVVNSTVEFAITADAVDLHSHSELILIPCYRWNHCILVPKDHALASFEGKIELQDLQTHPLVTYVQGTSGRISIEDAFTQAGLQPHIVFTATDADVVKTYVRQGLGIAIASEMVYDRDVDTDLVCIDVSHIIPSGVTHICVRSGGFLRGFILDFIDLSSPSLTKEMVESVVQCHNQSEVNAIFDGLDLPKS